MLPISLGRYGRVTLVQKQEQDALKISQIMKDVGNGISLIKLIKKLEYKPSGNIYARIATIMAYLSRGILLRSKPYTIGKKREEQYSIMDGKM